MLTIDDNVIPFRTVLSLGPISMDLPKAFETMTHCVAETRYSTTECELLIIVSVVKFSSIINKNEVFIKIPIYILTSVDVLHDLLEIYKGLRKSSSNHFVYLRCHLQKMNILSLNKYPEID